MGSSCRSKSEVEKRKELLVFSGMEALFQLEPSMFTIPSRGVYGATFVTFSLDIDIFWT